MKQEDQTLSIEERILAVNRIYDNPKPIIDEATALLRSVPE